MRRRIQILGGISHESTAAAYRRIHRRYHELRGDTDQAEVPVQSFNFRKFTD